MNRKITQLCIRRNAFTLAEILVVLTIVGIIAVLTIPTLIQNIQMAQYKTALKQTTSDLSGALRRMVTDNAGTLIGTFTDGNSFKNKMSSYLNIARDCNGVGIGNCWPTSTLYMDKSFNVVQFNTFSVYNDPSIVLSNGVMVHVDFELLNGYSSPSCTSNWGGESKINNVCLDLIVDINGLAPPNMLGYDTFRFFVRGDGIIVPFGASTTNFNPITECVPGSSSGQGCTANYLMGN